MSLAFLERVDPQEQGSPVRDILDPAHQLPSVTLLRDTTHDPYSVLGQDQEPTYGFTIVDTSIGVEVGTLLLAERPDTGDYHLANVEVEPTGHGYGMAAYLLAIEVAGRDTRRFVTDHKLTIDSLRVWKRFINLGLAEQCTPLVGVDPTLPLDQQHYYTLEAQIDPSELS